MTTASSTVLIDEIRATTDEVTISFSAGIHEAAARNAANYTLYSSAGNPIPWRRIGFRYESATMSATVPLVSPGTPGDFVYVVVRGVGGPFRSGRGTVTLGGSSSGNGFDPRVGDALELIAVNTQASREAAERAAGSLSEIASYPPPGSDGHFGPGSPATVGGTGLKTVVDRELRAVIGGLPKTTDARAITEALDRSFAVAEREGQTVVTWTPRAYSVSTDLGGGVVGAQGGLV